MKLVDGKFLSRAGNPMERGSLRGTLRVLGRGPSEFEIQAELYVGLRKLLAGTPYVVRGEVGTRLARFDIAIFHKKRVVRIVEVKRGRTRCGPVQRARYELYCHGIDVVRGAGAAQRYLLRIEQALCSGRQCIFNELPPIEECDGEEGVHPPSV